MCVPSCCAFFLTHPPRGARIPPPSSPPPPPPCPPTHIHMHRRRLSKGAGVLALHHAHIPCRINLLSACFIRRSKDV